MVWQTAKPRKVPTRNCVGLNIIINLSLIVVYIVVVVLGRCRGLGVLRVLGLDLTVAVRQMCCSYACMHSMHGTEPNNDGKGENPMSWNATQLSKGCAVCRRWLKPRQTQARYGRMECNERFLHTYPGSPRIENQSAKQIKAAENER